MNPQNQQKREIKFSSQKNGRLLVVNSEAAMSIASELESNSSVISYELLNEFQEAFHRNNVKMPDGYDWWRRIVSINGTVFA